MATVAENGDVLLSDSNVFNMRVRFSAPLLDCCEHQETVAILREHRMLVNVEPGSFGGALGVSLKTLHNTNLEMVVVADKKRNTLSAKRN